MITRIRKLREEHGLTLSELASRAGCSESGLSAIETRACRPVYVTAARVSYLLAVDPGEIFSLIDGLARLTDES